MKVEIPGWKWCVDRTLILFLILASPSIFADGLDGKKSMPSIENIGFIKNPPKALKEKFPMCDAFLKVEWIDKEKKIGYSHYELYGEGIKNKRKAFALIHIDQSLPHFDYDLSVYERGRDIGIEKVFSIIKRGKVFFNTFVLSIEYGVGERLDFALIEPEGTLSDHQLSVCIPFPNNQRIWIAEQKSIEKMYSKEKAAKLIAQLKMIVPDMAGYEFPYLFDLNHDGLEDYFIRSVVYSYGDKYYEMKKLWKHDADDQWGKWSFPPTQKKCELTAYWGPVFLTSDGKSFFLNNQCNLTELTKGEK